MDVGLGIAGLICVAMAFGHEAIGSLRVLPGLTKERLPDTPFGSSSMTVNMVRVTWHIVTIFVLAIGGILLTVAWDPGGDPKTVVLRWFAAMWLTAAVMAFWVVWPRWRQSLRLPVPLFWVVVAVLCWTASS